MLYHTDTSQKFSGKANNYHKYRPDYPEKMIGFLYQELRLHKNSVIADIGSGTGILSQHFVKRENKTYGIENNPDMRCKAKEVFCDNPLFISINGSAEKTTLPDKSINLITAAQSFHWFKPSPTHDEFIRILKPDGYIALIWNMKQQEAPFIREYNKLLVKHCPRYKDSNHGNYINKENINLIYGKEPKEKQFDNVQSLDIDGLIGRTLSLGYVDIDNKDLLQNLKKLFDEYNSDGHVNFIYKTHILYGKPYI